MGEPEKVQVGGIELEIRPLTVGDLSLFEGQDLNNPSPALMQKLIKKVLKESVPDATPEELEGISVQHIEELSKHIERINKIEPSSEAKIRTSLK